MAHVTWTICHEADLVLPEDFYEEQAEETSLCVSIDTSASYYLYIASCKEEDEGSCVVDEELVDHIWRCVEDELGDGHMRMSKQLDYSSVQKFLLSLDEEVKSVVCDHLHTVYNDQLHCMQCMGCGSEFGN